MYVPRPLLQLHFCTEYNFKKAFNSDKNNKNRGLQSISFV